MRHLLSRCYNTYNPPNNLTLNLTLKLLNNNFFFNFFVPEKIPEKKPTSLPPRFVWTLPPPRKSFTSKTWLQISGENWDNWPPRAFSQRSRNRVSILASVMSSHRLPVEESLDRKLQGSRHFWASFFLRLRKTCRLGPRFCGFFVVVVCISIILLLFRISGNPQQIGDSQKKPWTFGIHFYCATLKTALSMYCWRATSALGERLTQVVQQPPWLATRVVISCHVDNPFRMREKVNRQKPAFLWVLVVRDVFFMYFLYEMSDVRTPENPQNHRFYTERLAPQPTAVLHCWPSLFWPTKNGSSSKHLTPWWNRQGSRVEHHDQSPRGTQDAAGWVWVKFGLICLMAAANAWWNGLILSPETLMWVLWRRDEDLRLAPMIKEKLDFDIARPIKIWVEQELPVLDVGFVWLILKMGANRLKQVSYWKFLQVQTNFLDLCHNSSSQLVFSFFCFRVLILVPSYLFLDVLLFGLLLLSFSLSFFRFFLLLPSLKLA